ncbi:MAG: ornithine carbamoyltransferase [Clostridia bacterium]|nr:ornithine carbamoyltransferase [Clostridia bacterium]MBR2972908.1 ornithine carbamoyltransferase [Clostridia bacterium]MBR3575928.1 ornithine carbamoyltransferase [Clostridia bacterium]
MKKDLLSLNDYSEKEILDILELAHKLKKETKEGKEHHILKGKTLGMIFSKSSTRTRVSFEVGMYQLGGYPLFLSSNDIQLGRGECIEDTARVLSRYLDGIMIRTYDQAEVEMLAKYADIPIINGLTDLLHPCQVLADLMTIQEKKGGLKGLKMCYIGDGNNMANTLLHGCAKVGMDISVATPAGYECDAEMVAQAMEAAKISGAKIEITTDPQKAIANADAVYSDTWVSMGQEEEKQKRINDFAGFTVDDELMSYAKSDAIFLHCLPAYRGYEVTNEVIEGPHSVIFDEAENRLHAQKAVMVTLMKD